MNLEINGIKYSSYKEYYYKNKNDQSYSYNQFIINLKKGESPEVAIQQKHISQKNFSVLGNHTVEGITYPNLPSIARKYGFKANAIYKRFSRGMRGDNLVPKKLLKSYVPKNKIKKFSKREIQINGRKFRSKADACRQNNILYETFKKRIEYGWSLAEALGIEKRQEVTKIIDQRQILTKKKEEVSKKKVARKGKVDIIIYGKKYASYRKAADAYGVSYQRIYNAIYNNIPLEEVVRNKEKPKRGEHGYEIIFHDKKYLSISNFCKENSVARGTVLKIIKNGGNLNSYSLEQLQKGNQTKGHEIMFRGKHYPSYNSLAKDYNIFPQNLAQNLKRGYTVEQAVGLGEKGPNKKYSFKHKEIEYVNFRDFCKKNKLNYTLFYLRKYKLGLSLDEILKLKNKKIVNKGVYNFTLLKRDKKLALKDCFFYILKFNLNNEILYKIGITTKTVEKRISTLGGKRKIDKIFSRKSTLEKCFKIEQLILRKYAKYRWIDNDILEPLDGRTEFLKVDQNKIKEIEELAKIEFLA